MSSNSAVIPSATEIRGNEVKMKLDQEVIYVKDINKRSFLMKQRLREVVMRPFFRKIQLPPQTYAGASVSMCLDPSRITLRIKGAKRIASLGRNVCTNYNYYPPRYQQMQNYWIVGSGEPIVMQDTYWDKRGYALWFGRNWKQVLDTASKVAVVISAALYLLRLRVMINPQVKR